MEGTDTAVELVEPDLAFKRRILGLGAHDLSLCYQCGTCSVVCPLSSSDNPFPRKEMVFVQWGLTERALSQSSIWLCHQCGTCTTYCPREANPSAVMSALREESIAHYAVPKFMGRAMAEPKFLPLLFALPALLLLAVLALTGKLTGLPQGEIVYSKLFSTLTIEIVFVASITLSLLGAAAGAARYWRAMSTQRPVATNGRGPVGGLVATLLTIFRHRRFKDCQDEPVGTRETHKEHLHRTHLFAFYGFMGLVITTTSVGIGIYVFDYPTPWPVWHPVKILGNVSGIALFGALAVFWYRRIADRAKAGKSTYPDWLLIAILVLTVLTGFLSELVRLADIAALAYPSYYVHLVLVFFLLVYLPYTKFAHLLYRTVAMAHDAVTNTGGSAGSQRGESPIHRAPSST